MNLPLNENIHFQLFSTVAIASAVHENTRNLIIGLYKDENGKQWRDGSEVTYEGWAPAPRDSEKVGYALYRLRI